MFRAAVDAGNAAAPVAQAVETYRPNAKPLPGHVVTREHRGVDAWSLYVLFGPGTETKVGCF